MKTSGIPQPLFWGMVAACALPLLLSLGGIDLGGPQSVSGEEASGAAGTAPVPAMGAVHLALEWTAFLVAASSLVMICLRDGRRPRPPLVVLGIVLLFSGSLDLFHGLAAEGLIPAGGRELGPLSWSAARIYKALCLPSAAAALLLARAGVSGRGLVLGAAILLASVAGAMVMASISAQGLPGLPWGEAARHPADLWALALFIAGGLAVYPVLRSSEPRVVWQALLLGLLPDAAAQLAMAFGSPRSFDDRFMVAHLFKIAAYAAPLFGILVEQSRSYRQAERSRVDLSLAAARSSQEREALAEEMARLKASEETLLAELSEMKRRKSARTFRDSIAETDPTGALGRLVAEVAHDMKNPLASVSMGVDYLAKHLRTTDRDITTVLEEMKQAIKRGDAVIRSLTGASAPRRDGPPEPQSLPVIQEPPTRGPQGD